MKSQKRQNDLCSFPKQTIQYHVIQAYAPTSNTEEAKVGWFYEDLQDLLELTPKRDVLFIMLLLLLLSRFSRDWNAKAEVKKHLE